MSRDEILQVLKEAKPILQERYKLRKLGLFGSHARGDSSPESDVDIAIEIEPKLEYLLGVETYLETQLHKKVDVIRLHSNLRERFKNRIIQEMIDV